jgi:hypothetical protein
MDKVHKPITTQYYTPSSKPFRIYIYTRLCCFSVSLAFLQLQYRFPSASVSVLQLQYLCPSASVSLSFSFSISFLVLWCTCLVFTSDHEEFLFVLIEFTPLHLQQVLVFYQNQQPHVTVWKCVIHTVYLLHVSATHVAIFREVHDRKYMYLTLTEFMEAMHRYKILNFKNNTQFKYIFRINLLKPSGNFTYHQV